MRSVSRETGFDQTQTGLRLPEKTQPRYVAYATAHGRSPAEMLEADIVDWHGGRMAGFITWIGRRWTQWRTLRGVGREAALSESDHHDFDAWLQEKVATYSGGPRSSVLVHATTCTIDVAEMDDRGRRRFPCICSCEADGLS